MAKNLSIGRAKAAGLGSLLATLFQVALFCLITQKVAGALFRKPENVGEKPDLLRFRQNR
jgi:hypothetical protein